MISKSCPQCPNRFLQAVSYGNVTIDVCKQCGGFWFDKDELCQIVRQQSPESKDLKCLPNQLGARLELTELSCPGCTSKLGVYNLSTAFRFEVHACEQCQGLWLEKGELEHTKLLGQHEEAMAHINQERTWANWLFQFFLTMPVEFNIKPKRIPAMTISIIALCFLVFGLEYTAPSPDAFMERWGVVQQNFPGPEWFMSLITHQFLHSGGAHLLGNMYFLYILGDNLEDVMGQKNYLLFYLFSGIVGAVSCQFFDHPGRGLMVGASGAIAGIMAAYLVFFRYAKLTVMAMIFQFKISAAVFIGFWVVVNILGHLAGVGKIAWTAHLGGFATGLAIALVIRTRVLEANPILRYMAENAPPRRATIPT